MLAFFKENCALRSEHTYSRGVPSNTHPPLREPKNGLNPPQSDLRVGQPPQRENRKKPPQKHEFWPSGWDDPYPESRKNWTPLENFRREAPKTFVFQRAKRAEFFFSFFLSWEKNSSFFSIVCNCNCNDIVHNCRLFWPPWIFLGNQPGTCNTQPPPDRLFALRHPYPEKFPKKIIRPPPDGPDHEYVWILHITISFTWFRRVVQWLSNAFSPK